mmetsp:Transcript_15042/g.13202  ORF Transcript_15042/g.13202 Transcript_15042/m.13202 type:complete len:142 (+) Transcript_15042:732-1157(+)
MCLCFITKESSEDGMSILTNSETRNLQEEFIDPYLNQSAQELYNDQYHFNNKYRPAHGMNDFLEFIKFQRYNFFSKVESDYLVEPENETLQVFKPDDNFTGKTKTSIEQKLDDVKTTSRDSADFDEIEDKNRKYNNIESLI